MTWPSGRSVEKPALPEACVLRSFVNHDEFVRVQSAIGWEMRKGQWEELSARLLPQGMVFCEHKASGEMIGVACALAGANKSAELAWVAVVPDHRGHGLAAAICSQVVALALAAGFTEVTLTTRDDRLAAIKTYLKLGFEPVLEPATGVRWQRVLSILNWPGAVRDDS